MRGLFMLKFNKVVGILLAAILMVNTSVVGFADIDTGTKETPQVVDVENERMNEQKERAVPRSTRATYYSTNVTVYPQITGYYCGPATAYSLLRNWNVSVPSTTKTLSFFEGCPNNCPYPSVAHVCVQSYTSPQITLADSMGVGYSGADFIMLRNEINERLPSNYYSYTTITSDSALSHALITTLDSDHTLIGWVYASDLDRYAGSGFGGHYVNFYSYNTTTGKVGIADPNYMATYGGKYTEDLTTLREAMYRSSGVVNLLW